MQVVSVFALLGVLKKMFYLLIWEWKTEQEYPNRDDKEKCQTITIYFAHPSRKLKLLFDLVHQRATKNDLNNSVLKHTHTRTHTDIHLLSLNLHRLKD